MKCRKARQLLSPYIDDELKAKEKAALEEHLASCEACRAELEDLKAISETVRDVFRRIEPPPDLLEKTMRRIRQMEESGEIARLRRRERLARWRKAAVGVGLAAGIGLAALQFGRAGLGPAVPPGVAGAPVARVAASAEGASAAPEAGLQAQAKPQAEAGGEAAGVKVAPAAENKAARPEVPKAETRVAAVPNTGAGAKVAAGPAAEQPGRPAEEAEVASAAGATAPGGTPPRVFLNGSRHVRTTMVKLEVADLEAAKAAVAGAAIKAQAAGVQEAWSYQQKEAILRVVLPVGAAGQFLADVARLGSEVERKTETADVTAEFNRRLAEYQEFSAKADPQSQAMAKAAAQLLEGFDRESLEAGREVVNVWLKLR